MGKGFNNYMCKKFFHPASRDNLKRVWMAQQKDDAYKKKQEELRVQYEKEQDLYNNKAMLSKESKDKLSVNFMYEPPPGAKKEREKEENEPEYKFEWQRKYNAPREDYCKGNAEIQDQPFGILVRNVRCIKCRKWGHINTDKECPLYNQSVSSEIENEASDALSLLRGMREDGLRMRKTALDAQQHVEVPRFKGMVHNKNTDDGNIDDAELQFLKSLSNKEKLKLLRKLEKLESGVKKQASSESDEDDSSDDEKRKKKKRKHKSKDKHSKKDSKKKSKRHHSESEDNEDSEDEENYKKKKLKEEKGRHNKGKKKTRKDSDSDSETSSSSEEEDDRRKHKRKETQRRKRHDYNESRDELERKKKKSDRREDKFGRSRSIERAHKKIIKRKESRRRSRS